MTQITLPKKLRDKLGIKEGDKVDIRLENNRIVVEAGKTTFDEDFLPKDFKNTLKKLRSDSAKRFKRLGIVP
jgi:AbrB family looped-hinge helix DNA binding protein